MMAIAPMVNGLRLTLYMFLAMSDSEPHSLLVFQPHTAPSPTAMNLPCWHHHRHHRRYSQSEVS